MFCVANRVFTLTRRAGKSLWENFAALVRKSDVEYSKNGSEHYSVKMRTIIATPQNGFKLREETRQIHESELPFPVRKEMYEKNADKANVDSREILRRKYEDELADEA